ncbi:hypothetical protein [Bradyrhizobium guangdongense]
MNDNEYIHSATSHHKTPPGLIIARGRLKDARKWFEIRGWRLLPHDDRGRAILAWGADHAYLASPTNPKRSIRNWCRSVASWLSKDELEQIVATTIDPCHNKVWTHDQSAAVLEIGVSDREAHQLWFIGADNDPNYEHRLKRKREKNAARAKKSRGKNSSGRNPGRPALQLSGEARLARKRAQDAKRAKELRARKKAAAEQAQSDVAASRKNASRHITEIGSATEFSVTQPHCPSSAERLKRDGADLDP